MRHARRRARRSARPRLGLVLLILTAGLPSAALGQFNEVPPPAAYALQGVTVIRPDGTRLEGVTVVIRNHAIEVIGSDVAVPEDAELLAGDSLLVYPGLIDADGDAEYEFPETEEDGEQILAWNPPPERQGYMPERRVVDYLTDVGEDLSGARKKGVVAAAVHPANALMPGQGALLLFRPGAETPRELVLNPSLGLVMAFRGGRGVYPSQLFGVIAFMRQQFEDATRADAVATAHARDARGMPTPTWDPSAEAVRTALSGAAPVYFWADEDQMIRRVLGLADEYGFRPIIVGGDEAWKVADELARRNIPVLVSLDFPEPVRWEQEEETEEPEEGEETPPNGESSATQTAEPEEPAVWREKKRLEDMYANAAKLVEAGVRFALTSGGGSADLLEGARLAMEYGLSEADALTALTAGPAEILGAPYLGRVDAGYPANLIVTDGPLFEEDTKLLYTFVEGELEETGAASGDPAEEATVDVTGSWKIEIQAEGLTINGTMTLTQDGSHFEGTMDLDVGAATVRDGTVSGNSITATIVPEGDDGVEMKGTVTGDEASGTGRQGEFSFTWKATRTPGGER